MLLSLYSDFSSFHHRATRLELWLVHIVIGLLNIGFTFLILYYLGVDKLVNMLLILASASADPSALMDATIFRVLVAIVAMILYYLLTFLLPIATTVRRLHDLNLSGWWLPAMWLGMFLVDYGAWYLAKHFVMTTEILLGVLVVRFGVHILYFIFLFFWPGTKGPNKYGADAREIRAYIRKRVRQVKEKRKKEKTAGAQSAK